VEQKDKSVGRGFGRLTWEERAGTQSHISKDYFAMMIHIKDINRFSEIVIGCPVYQW
jgi:hypothetical protein